MSTRKALTFSFLDRYASLILNVVASMALARLLTPAEVGVFSVIMVLLTFVATFLDLGAGQYLVQEKELTTERIRATWAVQLGLGLLLACVILLASAPVANFYHEPRMRDIMLVLALNYAINPFGSLTYAWLSREMRFDAIALTRFLSTLTGASVSVILAWKHFGPISLALGSLASTLANACIYTFFRPASFPWMPGICGIRKVLSFGIKLTSTTIMNSIATATPELVLAKVQSVTDAAFYSRANGVVAMFYRLVSDAVFSVSLSLFSRQSRQHEDLSGSFLKALSYITAVGWSFCFSLVFLAHPTILFLYGGQWVQSVDLTRLLAIATAFNVPGTLCISALIGHGAVAKLFRATAINTPLFCVFSAIGSIFGLMSLGFGIILATSLGSVVWLRTCQEHFRFSWNNLWAILLRSILVSAIAAVAPAVVFVSFGAHPEDIALPLILGAIGAVLGFCLGVFVTKHPIGEEFRLIAKTLASGIINKKKI